MKRLGIIGGSDPTQRFTTIAPSSICHDHNFLRDANIRTKR